MHTDIRKLITGYPVTQSTERFLSQEHRMFLGGRRIDCPGYFVEPTLFKASDNSHTIVQEKIFGLVLVALKFDDDDQAMAMANDNIYGLATI